MDVSHRALFANKSARAATIYDDIAWSVRRGRGLTCSELLPSVTCAQVREMKSNPGAPATRVFVA